MSWHPLIFFSLSLSSLPPFLINEETLTHHDHPKSNIFVRVHSRCCTFCALGHMSNDRDPSLEYHTEYFHCPKHALCPTVHPLLPGQWSSCCPYSCAFAERQSWNLTMCSLFALLHWITHISISSMSFHGSRAHFFLILSNSPLFVCATVYPAYQFGQLLIKLL